MQATPLVCSILPNKKATTQTAATQKVVEHIVALANWLSEKDFRGVVSDCAANEVRTNQLEGNIVAAPCLIRCGAWDPPDVGDEVSWLCCPLCCGVAPSSVINASPTLSKVLM